MFSRQEFLRFPTPLVSYLAGRYLPVGASVQTAQSIVRGDPIFVDVRILALTWGCQGRLESMAIVSHLTHLLSSAFPPMGP